MDEKETLKMKEALTKLLNVAPDDVLELKEVCHSSRKGPVYGLVNETRNKQVLLGGTNGSFVEILLNASKQGLEMYNRLFESDGDKAKKDIFDMMA